jgi:NADH-quinone oxidoreductase subunit D
MDSPTRLFEPPCPDLAELTEELEINMGPQHPSTHGVLRVVLRLSGEVIREATPHVGYLHRAQEKLAEQRTYVQGVMLSDRWDYVAAMTNELAVSLATEKLLDVEVPPRAQWIRLVMAELQRIASHLLWLGTFGLDIAAMTLYLYCFREREAILGLFEETCGQRLLYNYIRPGGVRNDLPDGFVEKAMAFLEDFPTRIQHYDELFSGNAIVVNRLKGVARLDPELGKAIGASGPVLRGSGVGYDVRAADPYLPYDQLDWQVQTQDSGDCYGRYLVRVAEMRESTRMLKQALRQLPEGEVRAKLPRKLKPREGTAYAHIESPRGDLGVFLVSDGSDTPYRCKIRAPSFCNLMTLPYLARGWKVADMVAILGSLDIVLGEIDR